MDPVRAFRDGEDSRDVHGGKVPHGCGSTRSGPDEGSPPAPPAPRRRGAEQRLREDERERKAVQAGSNLSGGLWRMRLILGVKKLRFVDHGLLKLSDERNRTFLDEIYKLIFGYKINREVTIDFF